MSPHLAIERVSCLVALMLIACVPALTWAATGLDFSLHKHEAGAGNTILVVGGIQGDEPGGFNAASLLVTNYRFEAGNVWIVPNLNFESIVKRSRGVHGDMNRKFSTVSPKDPDYDDVARIKSIIRDPAVDYVFNLHDGSGFYRPKYQNKLRSPRRWGQSIIIDQAKIETPVHADLAGVAQRIADKVNQNLVSREHRFHVKNTRTGEGNKEMAKTLTWYAVGVGKPAVGVEASKELPTHLRAYYHLVALEAYMQRLGVRFERDFELNPTQVRKAIDDNIRVSFYDQRMYLDMRNARKRLRFVPLKKNAILDFKASSPLIAILNARRGYRVNYGNRRVTYLDPQFFEYDTSVDGVDMLLDGRRVNAIFGSIVNVRERFRVLADQSLRVNVIGWRRKGLVSESGVDILRGQFARRFSVDKAGRIFRVEVYKGKKFAGMVLVRFVTRTANGGARRPRAG